MVGGADALEEVQERMPRFRRQYKIQEVIKRRQVMLVQVVKEERGTKGAALTTYLSLAGRYSVLMPNTARGGGISPQDHLRRRPRPAKDIAAELEVPEGMGVILRTAGASRTKTEVKRDFEYLLRLWETGARSDAEIDGADAGLRGRLAGQALDPRPLLQGYRRDRRRRRGRLQGCAQDFMRMLMPSHVKNVKLYKDSQPIFTRYGIESQLDAMFSPMVQLSSGGYIVINQAEALVAIDVNSGRATREHHIEDTALKTNGEAAEEIARQLRLRDLAGLIVIDFIDMDETRNNRTVERRLKEALKYDRARIQVGRISHFGLLEMSRQRIRTSVLESSTEKCPVCGGSGHVRSVSSVALQLLRALEEMLIKGATHNLIVRTRSEVALYVLNHKRAHLRALEERFRITITISADATVTGQQSYVIDRGEQVHSWKPPRPWRRRKPGLDRRRSRKKKTCEDEAEVEAESDEASRRPRVRARRRQRSRRRTAARRRPAAAPARTWPRTRRRTARAARGRGNFTHETVAEHAVAHEDHDGGCARGRRASSGAAAASGPRHGAERRAAMAAAGGAVAAAAAAATGATAASATAVRRRPMRHAHHGGDAEPELRHAVEDLDRPPAPRERASRPAMRAGRDFPPVSEEDADAYGAALRPRARGGAGKSRPRPNPNLQPSRRAGARPCASRRRLPSRTRRRSPTLPPPTPVISSTASR